MSSAPEIKGGGVLGEKVTGYRRQLDVFELPANVKRVTYSSDEVTALCPVTNQPDWYTVTIWIYETERGIESKSLKLYLHSFRDEGHFCEQFADIIAQDVKKSTGAGHVDVTVDQKSRGGVSISANAEIGGAIPDLDLA